MKRALLLTMLICLSCISIWAGGCSGPNIYCASENPSYSDYSKKMFFYPLAAGDSLQINCGSSNLGCPDYFWGQNNVRLTTGSIITVTQCGTYKVGTTGLSGSNPPFYGDSIIVYPADSPLAKYTGIPSLPVDSFKWSVSEFSSYGTLSITCNETYSEAVNYAIINISGQPLLMGTVQIGQQNGSLLDISMLSAGIYFISVDFNGRRDTKKFVKL